MQENLQKAFMRGVCALNFEAMNILSPNDTSSTENELEKQVSNAVGQLTQNSNTYENPINYNIPKINQQQQQQYFDGYSDAGSDLGSERKFLQID